MKRARARAALGFRAHSGWAALVAVGVPNLRDARTPAVLERRRIVLIEPGIPKQPYHAAENLELKKAEKLIGRSRETARRLARAAVRAVVSEMEKKGYQVVGAGLLLASGRPLPSLEATLASHALIHAAEGELFREALAQASKRSGLPVKGVREREVYERGAAGLRLAGDKLRLRLSEMGGAMGAPWTQDEKLAALVAWMVLAGV